MFNLNIQTILSLLQTILPESGKSYGKKIGMFGSWFEVLSGKSLYFQGYTACFRDNKGRLARSCTVSNIKEL